MSSNHILPQNKVNLKFSSPLLFNEEPPQTLTCTYCAEQANPNVTPPLCLEHLDLVILLEFMQRRDMIITSTTVKEQLIQAIKNGGDWSITETDIDRLLPQMSTFANFEEEN